jgi:hemin uptake protein HemP
MVSQHPQAPIATPTLPPTAQSAQPASRRDEVARISSDELLAGALEVQIEHRGSLYRLRQTSLGKLILTK